RGRTSGGPADRPDHSGAATPSRRLGADDRGSSKNRPRPRRRREPAALAGQGPRRRAASQEVANPLVGTFEDGRPVSKIGALEAERLESLGRLQRALMGVIDVPGWGADSPFVVQD